MLLIRCDRCKCEGADRDVLGLKVTANSASLRTYDLCNKCRVEFQCVLRNTDDFTTTLDEILSLADNPHLDLEASLGKIVKVVEAAKERRRG